MKSKQNSSRISLTKSLGNDDYKSNIHNPKSSCDIASMKPNDEFPTPIILPITSNVLMHDNLMPQKQIMEISKKICKKLHKHNTYFKWRHEHIEKLEHLMKIHDHCSFKTIANIFYKHNVHPMLNTQKIHDELKRLRKSQKNKNKKKFRKTIKSHAQ
jgi:hypothetical protein